MSGTAATSGSVGSSPRGRIPEEVIARIRDQTDIVEVIGRHVQLKRAGTNMKGLCPFHEEKTPSFNVNPDRQFFHCFGCHASGDVIAFLMQVEGRSFSEVIEELAQHAGIDLPRESTDFSPHAASARGERQRARELNQRVAQLYRRYLDTPGARAARAYLERRGIGQEVGESFQLGFAPPKGSLVVEKLTASGCDLAFAAQIGLIAPRRYGSGYHDRFWNRLMFPVIAVGGDVLGFGGRAIEGTPVLDRESSAAGQASGDGGSGPPGDGQLAADRERGKSKDAAPKYLNSPETLLYRKSEVLYGLAQAASAIRKTGVALVVEGNFDVLQLHQHGFANAVAPMGTALTAQQVKLLGRFANEVVVLFDGDDAGRAAARKSITTLLDGDLAVKIATLPQGSDPDSFVREQGASAMQQLIDQAPPAVDFMIADLRRGMDDTIPARAKLLEAVAPMIAALSSRVAQDLYIDRLSMELGLDRSTVVRAVRHGAGAMVRQSARPPTPAVAEGHPATSAVEAAPVRLDPVEVELLKLLFSDPKLLNRAEHAQLAMLLTKDELRATYSAAVQMQRESGTLDAVELLRGASPAIRDAVARAASASDYASDGDTTRALDDCVATLVAARLVRLAQAVAARIGEARVGVESRAEGESHDDKRNLIKVTEWQAQIRRARAQRDAEKVWALVPELVRAEREIHET